MCLSHCKAMTSGPKRKTNDQTCVQETLFIGGVHAAAGLREARSRFASACFFRFHCRTDDRIAKERGYAAVEILRIPGVWPVRVFVDQDQRPPHHPILPFFYPPSPL